MSQNADLQSMADFHGWLLGIYFFYVRLNKKYTENK